MQFSRRTFLKSLGVSAAGMAIPNLNLPDLQQKTLKTVRICKDTLSVHLEPDDASAIVYQRYRDDIVNVYEEVISEKGPEYNPLWYRVWGGYIHCANTFAVKKVHNPIQTNVNPLGQLAEVTVPYTQSFRLVGNNKWDLLYRLYYGSVHWVMDIMEGPDGMPWYKVKDEFLKVEYAVPTQDLRFIPDDELTPINPDVPLGQKNIEISLYFQTLKAFEGDKLVFETKISSGVGYGERITPLGKFNVQVKTPSKHMGDGHLTANIYDYELLGVPWAVFFTTDGIATHGTYWHNNFGSPMSRGCVNMRNEDAKWIYRWTTPYASPQDWQKIGYGTIVVVSK